MAKYDLKTKVNEISVEDFLNSFEPEQKKSDGFKILQMMQVIAGEEEKMWGTSIIGFGNYHYKYESGHEGDMLKIGFSPRKASLTLYISINLPQNQNLLENLGKHKSGKGCLYINKLSDINESVLREMIQNTWNHMNEKQGYKY